MKCSEDCRDEHCKKYRKTMQYTHVWKHQHRCSCSVSTSSEIQQKLNARMQGKLNRRTFIPDIIRHLFAPLLPTFFSNTSIQHSSPTLLCHSLLPHFSTTHLHNSLLQHFSATLLPTAFSKISNTFWTTLLYNTPLQHFRTTLLYNTLPQHFSTLLLFLLAAAWVCPGRSALQSAKHWCYGRNGQSKVDEVHQAKQQKHAKPGRKTIHRNLLDSNQEEGVSENPQVSTTSRSGTDATW